MDKLRGYCSKIHNALGALADGSLLLGEGNHFTWDGLPVTTAYFDRELPERMLARKRDQISDFAHHNMVITPSGVCYGTWLDMGDGALKEILAQLECWLARNNVNPPLPFSHDWSCRR